MKSTTPTGEPTTFNRIKVTTTYCTTRGCLSIIRQWDSGWGRMFRCHECAERFWRTGYYLPLWR